MQSTEGSAADTLANALSPDSKTATEHAASPRADLEPPISRTVMRQMIDEQLTLREHVQRLEKELQVVGVGGKQGNRK